MPKKINIEEYKNKRFGLLTAVNVLDKSRACDYWLCKCDCGNEHIVLKNNLENGTTNSCGCLKKRKKNEHPNYKGFNNISMSYFSELKHKAIQRNIQFDVTIEYLDYLFENQNRICAISGVPIQFPSSHRKKRQEQTASLDRINNNIGYVEGNLQWVHKICNRMKNHYSLTEFLHICACIINPINIESNSHNIDIQFISNKYYNNIVRRAKQKNFDINIDKEFLWDLFVKQQGKCCLTGFPIYLNRNFHSASLDRIDNNKGYTKDNVQWVYKNIQRIKHKFSEELLREMCRNIVNYNNLQLYSTKIWGLTRCVYDNALSEIHLLKAIKNRFCSFHSHKGKWNRFIVLDGSIKVIIKNNDKYIEHIINSEEHFDVSPGIIHRFETITDSTLMEIYWVDNLNMHDIDRLDVGGMINKGIYYN